MKTRAQLDERMQNLDHQTWLKKCGQLGRPSRSKLSLTNSEIQAKSRIRESILVFGGEIPLETWKLGSKFGKFLLYTHPLKSYLLSNKHSELRALRINTHIPSISTSTGELASTATALYPVLQYWSTSYQYASSLRSTTSTGSSTPSIQYCQSDLVPGTRVVQYEYKLYYSSSFFLPHQASLFSCKSENNENSLIREF